MFLPKCIFLLIASHVSQTAGESQFASADYAQQIQQIMRLKAQLDDAALSTPKQIMKHYSGTDVEVPLTGNKKKDEALMREKKSKQRPKSQRLSGKSASMITVDAGGGIQTQAQTPSPHRMRNPDPTPDEEMPKNNGTGESDGGSGADPASAENTTSPDPASDEDTTSPDEVVPDEVVPETTAPDEVTMSPAPAPDEDTTSPDPASDEDTTSPDEVVPETTAPDEVVPDEAPSGECEKSVTVNPEAAPKDQEKIRCDRVCRLYPKYAANRTNLGELLISVCPGCCGERLLEEAETPAGRCANWKKTVHEKSEITCKDAATWDEGSMCRERDETVVAMVTEACPDQCFASCCESCPDCCGTTP